MKNIITAIVALTMTTATQANATHFLSANCPHDCPKIMVVPGSTPATSSYLLADVKSHAEEKTAKVQFDRTMQQTLIAVNLNKYEEAIKDLSGATAYNNLMTQTLLIIENEKLNDQLEDLSTLERYENLMATILNGTVGL
jgi:molybdopterin-guanine dinucleotide biosynthesis protein A